jgi:phage tail-like protein
MKQDEIRHLLPAIFQRTLVEGNPLAGILSVMEELHAPAEEKLRTLDANFNPYRAPDTFVPFLARWVDLDRLFDQPSAESPVPKSLPRMFPTASGRLRELIAAAAYLSQWRGTSKGLLSFLETATGARGFEIEEQVLGPEGQPRPFHFLLCAPPESLPYRALIERIAESEKPAYVTYEVEFERAGRGGT